MRLHGGWTAHVVVRPAVVRGAGGREQVNSHAECDGRVPLAWWPHFRFVRWRGACLGHRRQPSRGTPHPAAAKLVARNSMVRDCSSRRARTSRCGTTEWGPTTTHRKRTSISTFLFAAREVLPASPCVLLVGAVTNSAVVQAFTGSRSMRGWARCWKATSWSTAT